MAKVALPTVTLNYRSVGDDRHPAMILIGGWKCQLTFWPEPLIAQLVDAGFRVIVFDNRDAGESTQSTRRYMPPSAVLVGLRLSPLLKFYVPYTVEDMAADVIGLMDHLHIDTAHIGGFSLGGMISQVLAAEFPERVRSLTVMGSTTNSLFLPPPPLQVTHKVFLTPDWFISKERRVKLTINRWKAFGTPDGHQDRPEFRTTVERIIDRSAGRMAARRQYAAGIATGDLSNRYTRRIRVPTLVLHGKQDKMLRVRHGADVAMKIPDARLEIIEDWGHDMALSVVPRVGQSLLRHLTSVE